MGKEISTLTELNQYEIINHKASVRLWLHDIVDEVKILGHVTAENLIAGITLGLDEVYAPMDHDHDEDYAALSHDHSGFYSPVGHDHDAAYAALTHDHDSDYADIAHNHDSDYADIDHSHSIYLQSATASWTGNTTTDGLRNINFSSITPRVILMLGYASGYGGFTGLWFTGCGTGVFNNRVIATTNGIWWITDAFNEAPSSGVLPLYSSYYNYSGYNYKALILGVS